MAGPATWVSRRGCCCDAKLLKLVFPYLKGGAVDVVFAVEDVPSYSLMASCSECDDCLTLELDRVTEGNALGWHADDVEMSDGCNVELLVWPRMNGWRGRYKW